MTTSELRIGNYVDVINRHHRVHLPYGFVKKVGKIEFFKVDLYEHSKPFATQEVPEPTDIADLSPIPLNEEWLTKCANDEYGFYKQADGSYSLIDDCGDGTTCYLGNLRYVHQLQNLYFALTGEELTIIQ